MAEKENETQFVVVMGKIIVSLLVLFYSFQFLAVGKLLFSLYFGYAWYSWRNKGHKKDTVTLHIPQAGKCIPNPSSFALKVETYLRMAQIPYEIDTKYPFGPKGKTPWITFNGIHVSDSESIIDFLGKEFNKDFSGKLTSNKKALVEVIRIVLEESTFWGGYYWRWIGGIEHTPTKVMNVNPMVWQALKFIMSRRAKKDLHSQGLGRLTESEIFSRTKSGLRRTSVLLGTGLYFGGDLPNEDDCGIFAVLAQAIYASPGAPFKKYITEELPNLLQYTERMKEKYWKDWDAKCEEIY